MKPLSQKRCVRILTTIALVVVFSLPALGQGDDPFGSPPATPEPPQGGFDPFGGYVDPDALLVPKVDPFSGKPLPPPQPAAKKNPKAELRIAPITLPDDWETKSPEPLTGGYF